MFKATVKCNLILLFNFQDFYTDMKFKTFRNGESLLFIKPYLFIHYGGHINERCHIKKRQ